MIKELQEQVERIADAEKTIAETAGEPREKLIAASYHLLRFEAHKFNEDVKAIDQEIKVAIHTVPQDGDDDERQHADKLAAIQRLSEDEADGVLQRVRDLYAAAYEDYQTQARALMTPR